MGRKCDNCGYEVRDSAKFCPNCGKKVKIKDSAVKKPETRKSELPNQKAGKHIVIKMIAGIVATAMIGSVAYAGYIKKTKKATDTTTVDSHEKDIDETEQTEQVEDEEFELAEEQIDEIRFASMLFDQKEKEKVGYDNREQYTLELDNNKVSKEILNSVVPGIACVLKNTESESEEEQSNETLTVKECIELLEDSFGYEVKNTKALNKIFTVSDDSDVAFSYCEKENPDTIYDTTRCVETGKNEYHFYTEVKSWNMARNAYVTNGIMDITAHKSKHSRIAGFIFDKIEFKTEDIGITSEDTGQIISSMLRAILDKDESRDKYNPQGNYDVNAMSNDAFVYYANMVMTYVDSVGKGKETMTTEWGVDDGTQILEEEFKKVCEETLGRTVDYDISAVDKINEGKVRFYRNYDTWYEVQYAQTLQKKDGEIKVTGTIHYPLNDNASKYFYTATGHADSNSELGMIIDKMEVVDYEEELNSYLSDNKVEMIRRQLGVPDSLENISAGMYPDKYSSDLGRRTIDISYTVNDLEVAGAQVDAITGVLLRNITPYHEIMKENSGDDNTLLGNSNDTSLSETQIKEIKKSLNVPDESNVTYEISEPYYWKVGERTLISIEFYEGGENVAGAAVDAHTAELIRDILMYSSR